MKILEAKNSEDFNEMATSWLSDCLAHSQFKIVQLPAGNTPTELYKYWEQNQPSILKKVMFQQIDEVISGPTSGCFEKYFQDVLPSYRHQFLPLGDDPIYPNIAILGVGENGHVAFHEPEINLNFNYGCVQLSKITCENLKVSSATWGLTYGAGHFIHCNSILILAKGKSKQQILQKALTINSELTPVSYLLNIHPLCTLLTDWPFADGTF